MRNKLVSVLLFGAALGLSACGGDSDSSGSTNVTPTNPTNPSPKPPVVSPPSSATCASTGISPAIVSVTVPNNGSCIYAISNVNSGVKVTYSCNNGTLNSGGVTSGAGININNYQFRCAK